VRHPTLLPKFNQTIDRPGVFQRADTSARMLKNLLAILLAGKIAFLRLVGFSLRRMRY
jgi:hypothetical protein